MLNSSKIEKALIQVAGFVETTVLPVVIQHAAVEIHDCLNCGFLIGSAIESAKGMLEFAGFDLSDTDTNAEIFAALFSLIQEAN